MHPMGYREKKLEKDERAREEQERVKGSYLVFPGSSLLMSATQHFGKLFFRGGFCYEVYILLHFV